MFIFFMKHKTIFFFIIYLFAFYSSIAAVDDSTGVILRENKVFILHKVDAGQGLFAVARRYNVHWTSVRDANPGSDKSISPGEILYVPTGKTEAQFWGKKKPIYSKNSNEYVKPKEIQKNNNTTDKHDDKQTSKTSFTIYYTVKKGETLYSIAEQFNTTVEFLMQLNNLQTDKVNEGMDILVPKQDEKQDATEKSNIKDSNTEDDEGNKQKDNDEILIEKKEETKKVEKEIDNISKKIEDEKQKKSDTIKESNSEEIKNSTEENNINADVNTPWKYTLEITNYPEYDIKKITETGQGKLTDDKSIDQTKDWVIHHNAPENTVILITNPVNNKTVYAKVVKNFNRTNDNQEIIFLTKNTLDFLEIKSKGKFNIKLSFAK